MTLTRGGTIAPDPARRILITGAGRGLGLEFARQLLERGDRVFAIARRPGDSTGLAALAPAHAGRLALVAGDVGDDASIEAARLRIESMTDGLDLLINNAATYGARGGSLDGLDFAELRAVSEVNVIGPLRVARAFLPLLRKGRSPKLINLTSLMGSMSDNRSGGTWAYRMSKAALNMAGRNLALELRADGITCVGLHPGWVRTEMGGPAAPLAVEESIASMIRTIDGLDLERTGAFLDRDGRPLPW